MYPTERKYKNEQQLAYDAQKSNSPVARTKEIIFRSTFHNTVNGKFNLDLPILNDKHDYSDEYSLDKRQSANNLEKYLHNKSK